MNSSEEGSYYSSIRDSSVGNYDNAEADQYEPEEVFYLSVNDDKDGDGDDDDSCGSGDNGSDDDGISINLPSSATFVGYKTVPFIH